jgi:thiosulfate/3-mercaptopyruvate sulfurtransferase
MKTSRAIIVAIVLIILGFLVVYSQTGLPEKKEGHEAAAAGYGGGGGLAKAPMPRLAFISLPGDEGVIPAGANLQLLAGIEDIEKNMRHFDWVIVDCRDKESYNEGHIPSAIHLGETCNDFFRGNLEVKGQGVFGNLGMRPVDELEKKLGVAGISMDKTIVFYDGKMGSPPDKSYGILAGYAFVPFWFMEYLGHQDVRVLDGGIMAWSAAGKPLETKENRLASTVFKAQVMKSRLATTEELAGAGSDPSLQIVDTRTPAEYAGTSATPPNHFLEGKIARAGHVPGVDLAAPHFYQFFDMETMKLRPVWQLKRIYGSLDTGKRTVAYCILGNRSSMGYFVMRLLGFKEPANYHDSWFVYGNTDGAPVEQSL